MNSDRDKLGATMSLWKGKYIRLLLISISSYLPLMAISGNFSIFCVKVMARVKANEIFCAILG